MSDHWSHPTAAWILPTLTSSASLHHLEMEDQLSLAQKTPMDHNSMVQEAGDMSEEQSGHVLGQSGHVLGQSGHVLCQSGHVAGQSGHVAGVAGKSRHEEDLSGQREEHLVMTEAL